MSSLYLYKIIRFKILLLFNIICVICPTTEDLQRCEEELYREFRHDEPLDNLLHGFLNVEYDSVNWSAETDTNENYFRGINGILKISARTYYYDLFNIAQEMGIPELLTPYEFCSEKHVNEEDECTRAIADIGCGPNHHGPDCFEKMYYHWVRKNSDDTPVDGTSHLSDGQLLEAICRGSSKFCDLPDALLFEAFKAHSNIIYGLSDDNLLQNFYVANFDAGSYRHSKRMLNRMARGNYENDPSGFYGDYAYDNYLKINNANDRRNDIFGYFGRVRFDEMNLLEARQWAYGITDVSYSSIVAEYKRRKTNRKYYDNLYAKDICEKFKNSSWDTTNFKNRADFCVDHLSAE